MKEVNGHLYETVEDWHTVIVRRKSDWRQEIVYKTAWLSEHCPDADRDYDAYCYHEDDFNNSEHRTIYFFRDPEVAFMFALRWA